LSTPLGLPCGNAITEVYAVSAYGTDIDLV